MHLKKLELSGFKSFARPTALEFPSTVTAIVGPNGSGKSNVVEGVRWVLGEQSLKTLRGKKGEDLIWNGSPEVPRVGRAQVTLTFDNQDGRIPLEFTEVSIGRKIFRDGLGEYTLNDSTVRLKDIIELVARVGLGETKHNIIGQGEVDRMLLASARDRREMLEEALGLRVHQLKKNEAERKLAATEENVAQVEALVREIAPHLKFLRLQAKRAEERSEYEAELKNLEAVYCAREAADIAGEQYRRDAMRSPFAEREARVRSEAERITREMDECERQLAALDKENVEDHEIAALETRRRELERELGRLEGKLDAERASGGRESVKAVDLHYVREEIQRFLADMRTILEEEDNIETVRSHLLALLEDLDELLQDITRGKVAAGGAPPPASAALAELEAAVGRAQKEITALGAQIESRAAHRSREQSEHRALQQKLRALDQALRALREEERDIAVNLERLRFDEDRIRAREEALAAECARAGLRREDLAGVSVAGFDDMPIADLRHKIERLRIKCEEVGRIDPAVMDEYRETESRHAFLTKEIEDLKQAASSLKGLIKELEQIIERDFKAGFSKIREEFNAYFKIIFGGGKASLDFVKEERPETDEFGETIASEAAEPAEEGIEISVEIPRKRIKGLQMLSGGERALASIALLFAFTAVNPPPFLILDETDAALDEANSQKYAAILKELSKKTQLLLVTHNRETMKAAGVLYGVTMGDDGVSRLLSLKLEEAEVYTNR